MRCGGLLGRIATASLVLGATDIRAEEEVVTLWEYQDKQYKYYSTAHAGYIKKCLPVWQDECRRHYGHDPELRQQLCESHLDRNYVKIRMQVPVEDIMDRWAKYKDWHDFDIGFYKAHAPQFTKLGFKKSKMPDELHKMFAQWYDMNRHKAVPEFGETAFGLHCNTGHDNDDFVVPWNPQLPEHKEAFETAKKHLMKLLSNMTGQDVNENTVTYGVRQYHRGSICGMHVDAPDTHAFGVVYQLYQRNMDEPWAFNYVTHEGAEHKAYLAPGELMLYEAATSLHGRKEPLRGDEFANLFFHFRSPNWVPGLEAFQREKYWKARALYEAEYSKSVGRPLYSEDYEPTRRHFAPTNSCLPIRGRGTPLMVEGHFMDIPPAEDYEWEDLKTLMESRGDTKTGRFAPFTAAEAKSLLVTEVSDTGLSISFAKALFLTFGLAGLVVTLQNIFRKRRDCAKLWSDSHSA